MSHPFATVEQRVSYGIGRQVGDQLGSNPFPGIDIAAIAQGLKEALEGTPSQVPAAELEAAFGELNARIEAQEAKKTQHLAAAGEAFLAQNALREGVIVTDSGLQYEILTVGDGPQPTASSTVSTHYHGTLIDGTVFDSSVQRGQPAEFPVNRVIAGWTQALQLMNVGSKWRLFVPYQLAYGERGAGGAIGPFSALIFDVELLAIVA